MVRRSIHVIELNSPDEDPPEYETYNGVVLPFLLACRGAGANASEHG